MLAIASAAALPSPGNNPGFAELSARLSEPAGFFDSNNLISNERSYLHVVPALREAGLGGGVYLGVGPDQNFTYIAQVKPSLALIVDIRRDNLLLHLLFKALFHLSSSRADYLSLLFGRHPPSPAEKWKTEDIERIAAYLDGTPTVPGETAGLRARVDDVIKRFGIPLSQEDVATIDQFHRTFIERGLAIRFESNGRPPRSSYPTYRDLLLETDRSGKRWNYLAQEADFQFVRGMEERDLVVPVVADLAGPTAIAAIGRLMKERHERLAAFYTSNVEYYLAEGSGFQRFLTNLAQLPHHERSVIIRSVFPNRYVWTPSTPGYLSASLVQRVDDLLDGVASGRFKEYADVLSGGR